MDGKSPQSFELFVLLSISLLQSSAVVLAEAEIAGRGT